jgi:SNF2 family DNA or RNA helicase
LREFSIPNIPPLKGFKSHLRDYQVQGLSWLFFLYHNHLSGLLCDDMGLGKTHQSMALMAAISSIGKKKPYFLIVAPTSVIYHWQDKLKSFLPKFKVHFYHGLKRGEKKLPKRGVIVTSYGVIRMEKERFNSLHFDLAIFDEIQAAKNPHSQIHKALSNINAKMRLGLTGTPIENHLMELKALFDIILPGFLPKEKIFKERFVIPIEKEGNEKTKELLNRFIKPFILRRRKKEVLQELPEKSEDKFYCDLSKEQMTIYKTVLEQRKKEIFKQIKNDSQSLPYLHIFTLLSTLKQICDHPALFYKDIENYKKYESGKWDLFVELLNEAIVSEQKVVIFSQYLQMLDIIRSYIKEKKWEFAEIRGATVKRKEEMERFQKDQNCKIFLGSLHAAGLGIDLTAASIVILYDRWWNAAKENQAIDRVHRIGQKWGVQVLKLISKETIEEKIDKMISKKGKLLEEIITVDDHSILKTFSRSELIELLQSPI